jgi:hypothetical protein
MAAIEALVLLVAAGFGLGVIATIVVIIGVHQEERRLTLARGGPPTVAARFARRVLGAHFAVGPVPRGPFTEDVPWAGHPADELVGR